jgi:hypothetical protein
MQLNWGDTPRQMINRKAEPLESTPAAVSTAIRVACAVIEIAIAPALPSAPTPATPNTNGHTVPAETW